MDISSATGTSPNTTSRPKYGSLQILLAATKSPQTASWTVTQGFESTNLQYMQSMAPTTPSRRSVSCFEFGSAERRYRTIRIGDDSEEMLRLAQANVTQLVKTATSTVDAGSNNALLARKALRFRKIWAAEAESESASAPCS